MRVRPLLPVAVLLLVPMLAACGDDDPAKTSSDPTSTTTSSDAPSSVAPESATTTVTAETTSAAPAETSAAPEPGLVACDLVTSDDIAKAFGVSFEDSGSGNSGSQEGNLAWEADTCSFEAKDLLEVTVSVTGTKDFTKGKLTCAQPSDDEDIVEPADDVAGASKGWWTVSSAPPLEATLRACSKTALIEVELDYEDGVDYEGDPRSQAISIAELVFSALEG